MEDERRSGIESEPRAWADTEWPAAEPEAGLSRGPVAAVEPLRQILGRLGSALTSAPPSVRLVYICLHMGVADSTLELSRCSGLPERTVRHAVRWLVGNGVVRRRVRLVDARRIHLSITPAPAPVAATA